MTWFFQCPKWTRMQWGEWNRCDDDDPEPSRHSLRLYIRGLNRSHWNWASYRSSAHLEQKGSTLSPHQPSLPPKPPRPRQLLAAIRSATSFIDSKPRRRRRKDDDDHDTELASFHSLLWIVVEDSSLRLWARAASSRLRWIFDPLDTSERVGIALSVQRSPRGEWTGRGVRGEFGRETLRRAWERNAARSEAGGKGIGRFLLEVSRLCVWLHYGCWFEWRIEMRNAARAALFEEWGGWKGWGDFLVVSRLCVSLDYGCWLEWML